MRVAVGACPPQLLGVAMLAGMLGSFNRTGSWRVTLNNHQGGGVADARGSKYTALLPHRALLKYGSIVP
jgi:hypothetical protein